MTASIELPVNTLCGHGSNTIFFFEKNREEHKGLLDNRLYLYAPSIRPVPL